MKKLVMSCMLVLLIGCNNNKVQSPDSQSSDTNPPELKFNNSDKSIETNGNMLVAFEKCKAIYNNSETPTAEKVDVSTLTRSPYSNIGKFVMVKGKVYKIEELPPNPNFPGKMTEVLLLADDKNSAVGATTIDCVCIGDTSHVKSNRSASCGGYFVGTYSTQNAMGGTVEGLAVVGNIAHGK